MKKIILSSILAGCLSMSYAQSGQLDLSFGEKGIVRTNLGAPANLNYASQQVLYQADGSYYLILETGGKVAINKRHADGSNDISYGRNGVAVSLVMSGPHAVMQPDGKIVIAGSTQNINTGFVALIAPGPFEIARFNSDGSLDNTFNTTGILFSSFKYNNSAQGVALQSDGKIVVTGVGNINNASNPVILTARYNTDGSLDESFGNGGNVSFGFRVNASCVAVQRNGKILVGGSVLLRYNSDGTPDNSFNGNGQEAIGGIDEIAVQADGKIVLRLDGGFSLARINANGGLDNTFDADGMVTASFGGINDQANSLAIESDGKIILAGKAAGNTNSSFAIARFNADGSPDNSFSGDGKQVAAAGSYSYVNSMAIQADGKLFALGINAEGAIIHIATARFNGADGSLDNSYNTTGIRIDNLNQGATFFVSTAVQADRKILAAGYSLNGLNVDFALTRYNMDGSLDNSFSGDGAILTDFGGADDQARGIAIQADGKIVLAGISAGRIAIARYNSNGAPDITFDGDGLVTGMAGNADSITAVVIQSDGKIMLAGTGIYRYNPNGSPDISFGINGKINTPFICDDLKIQGDGKILVVGKNFYSSIARYNTDGSPDINFASTGMRVFEYFANYVISFRSIALQNDGKILVSGSYVYYQREGTYAQFTLTRINSDGTNDITFNGGQRQSGAIYGQYGTSIAIQNDSKIIVGGYYQNGNNENFSLTRYNTNGSLDNTFGGGNVETPTSAANDRIAKLVISGNILYAAGFGEFPGNFGVVAKYLLGPESGPLPVKLTDFTATVQNNNTVLLQWQTASEQNLHGFTIERRSATTDFSPIGYVTAKGNTNTVTKYVSTDQQPVPGLNFYRLKMMDTDGQFSYSKIVSAHISEKLFSVRLSPNPAKNRLFVNINALTETATLQVIDANGIKLKEVVVYGSNTASISLDISNLHAGIYCIKLFTRTRMEIVRFMKE